MNNKNTGLIATVAAVVLCGCPGLFMCLFGAISVFASLVPGADINIGGSNSPAAAAGMGIGTLCLSIIFIAIPIAVWYFMLRNKPAAAASTPVDQGPLPPAS